MSHVAVLIRGFCRLESVFSFEMFNVAVSEAALGDLPVPIILTRELGERNVTEIVWDVDTFASKVGSVCRRT